MANSRILIFVSALLFFIYWKPGNLYSQDTIVTLKNKIIVCKVKEISKLVISYKNVSDTTRWRRINKSAVSRINYANGTKDIFNPLMLVPFVMDSTISMYKLGKKYGKLTSHYGHIAVSTFLITTAGTLLLAAEFEDNPEVLLLPPIGVLALAVVPPKKYIVIEETLPFNDPEFRRGFEKKRRIQKRIAALKGFAIGVLTDLTIVLLVRSSN